MKTDFHGTPACQKRRYRRQNTGGQECEVHLCHRHAAWKCLRSTTGPTGPRHGPAGASCVEGLEAGGTETQTVKEVQAHSRHISTLEKRDPRCLGGVSRPTLPEILLLLSFHLYP